MYQGRYYQLALNNNAELVLMVNAFAAGVWNVAAGESLTNVEITSAARLHVRADGTADDLSLSSGGVAYALELGTIRNVSVNDGGALFVAMAGRVENITVSGGMVHVATGGVVENVTIESGTLYLYGGAILDGTINIGGTIILDDTVQNNANINLILSAPSDSAMINDLSRLSVSALDVTVNPAAEGDYLLAGNASGFTESISVTTSEGELLGELAAGETLQSGDSCYSLDLSQAGTLSLNVKSVSVPITLTGTAERLSWSGIAAVNSFSVALSKAGTATAIRLETTASGVDLYALPDGTYDWSVAMTNGSISRNGDRVTASGSE
ncbi:MAG: hypothetical protein PHS41_08350 [Victivallaceae bacterium]|nr:hypothetical protein [Victivallaceae bacterium]